MEPSQQSENQYHFNVYRRFPVTVVKGNGSRLWDTEGKEYIDFLSGIAVNALGHNNRSVIKAIHNQAKAIIHLSNIYYNAPQARLAELLCKTTGYEKVFFCNSGLEANEAALKLARKNASEKGKQGPVISFENCFHGRSLSEISMGSEKYKKGFGPFLPGFKKLPFNQPEILSSNLDQHTAAVFVEPVQGEGGIIPATQPFMAELQRLCKLHGILLICDEIQSGMGRTGKFLAADHYGIKPDVVTMAKALGGGLPIGAVLTTAELSGLFKQGDHGTTFGGNPLVCAAAEATLTTILAQNLISKAGTTGTYFIKKLRSRLKGLSKVKEIRGLGLMIGVEMIYPCRPIVGTMLEKGFMINCTSDFTLRFLPPFIIKKSEIDRMVETLRGCIIEYEPAKN